MLLPLADGLLKVLRDQSWCWKLVGRERDRSQGLTCLVTRGQVLVAGRRAAHKVGNTAKNLQARWKSLLLPQPSVVAIMQIMQPTYKLAPGSYLPINYPSARADRPKKLVKLKGWFPTLLQGSGAVCSPKTWTWLRLLLSWQNHAQKSMLSLKAKCQHTKPVI